MVTSGAKMVTHGDDKRARTPEVGQYGGGTRKLGAGAVVVVLVVELAAPVAHHCTRTASALGRSEAASNVLLHFVSWHGGGIYHKHAKTALKGQRSNARTHHVSLLVHTHMQPWNPCLG